MYLYVLTYLPTYLPNYLYPSIYIYLNIYPSFFHPISVLPKTLTLISASSDPRSFSTSSVYRPPSECVALPTVSVVVVSVSEIRILSSSWTVLRPLLQITTSGSGTATNEHVMTRSPPAVTCSVRGASLIRAGAVHEIRIETFLRVCFCFQNNHRNYHNVYGIGRHFSTNYHYNLCSKSVGFTWLGIVSLWMQAMIMVRAGNSINFGFVCLFCFCSKMSPNKMLYYPKYDIWRYILLFHIHNRHRHHRLYTWWEVAQTHKKIQNLSKPRP